MMPTIPNSFEQPISIAKHRPMNAHSFSQLIASKTSHGRCRLCDKALSTSFMDLGMSPLCESFLTAEQTDAMEPFYPLHALVCDSCFLVQLKEYVQPEHIFTEYAYFSSYSTSWVEHARRYCEMIKARLALGANSRVYEIASNDGYLLQHFLPLGVPVTGIEPAANVAEVARKKNIPTLVEFFGLNLAQKLASEGKTADLIIGNNVLAQVPDLNDFTAGMAHLLAPQGVITLEFPHLEKLINENQFDTIYHEHFSYFSFHTVERIFAAHDLTLFDVEELPTHGGSLRIYARHNADTVHPVTERVRALREWEHSAGFTRVDHYRSFAHQVESTKRKLLNFLIEAKSAGKTIVGYGAPGKGNTLLNYCGIRTDFLDYTVDRNPHKQGKFLPGTHIPIFAPDRIRETRPDYVFILPWNVKDEIIEQMAYIRDWGGRFIVPIPEVQVH
jgi:SAM-dependent methyltransferase